MDNNTLRRRSDRAAFEINPQQYGQSALGAPLLYFPAQKAEETGGLSSQGHTVMKRLL